MKCKVIILVVLILNSCVQTERGYLYSFERFVEGLQSHDIKVIAEFSTEITHVMLGKIMTEDKTAYIVIDDGHLGKVISGKSIMQEKIALVRDSLASDNQSARIWFSLNDSKEVYCVSLVRRNKRWLVDIPLENFILY